MKKVILVITMLALIIPAKGFCMGEFLLVPSIFSGIKFIGSLFTDKSKAQENKKTEIAGRDQVEYAKEQAAQKLSLKQKNITFGDKYTETVINSQSTIITYHGTLNGQDTLISLGFKKAGDTLYRSVIVWDDFGEFKNNHSREKLVKVFAPTISFGPISEVTAPDLLRELDKLRKDNIISDTEYESKKKEILSRI